MATIKFDHKFLDQTGKELYNKIECVVLKPNGDLAKTPEGNYIVKEVDHPKEKLNLKTLCITALLNEFPNETPTADERYKRYKLFQKFDKANGKIDLEAEDLSLVKELIGKTHPTLIMGQAYDMLEGK